MGRNVVLTRVHPPLTWLGEGGGWATCAEGDEVEVSGSVDALLALRHEWEFKGGRPCGR